MPLTTDELMKRRADRLQSLYQSVEQGVPVDLNRHDLLRGIEAVQFGEAFSREALDRNKAADDGLERLLDGIGRAS